MAGAALRCKAMRHLPPPLPTPLLTAVFVALLGSLFAVLLGVGAARASGAQVPAPDGTDLLNTPACLTARQQFEALLAAGGPRDRLQAVRRQTALSCFGQEPAPPTDTRSTRSQFTVPAEPIRLRSEAALAPTRPPRPAAAAPQPPLSPSAPRITHCDAAGCWDDQGRHYDRQGPLLLGPGGPCQQADGLLNCP